MDILNNTFITYSNIRGLVDIDEKTLEHYSVEYGDIVFQRSSETMEDVGNTNVYLDKDHTATFGGFVIRGKKKGDYEPFFLKNLLCSPFSRKKIIRMGAGSQHFNIGQENLSQIHIALPTMEEQKKVASFLTLLDERITKQRELVEHLKSYKRGLLSDVFPQNDEWFPKLRLSGFNDKWQYKAMKEIGETFGGLTGKSKEDFGHGNARFVTYMNVFSNPISDCSMLEPIEIDESQKEIKYGDIFFTTSSETPEEVGMSSVWLGNQPHTYLNSFCFGFRPTIDIDQYFLAYLMRSKGIRSKIVLLAQGISRYNISKTKMLEIKLPLPSNAEQVKIGRLFKNIDIQLYDSEKKLTEMESMKKALLRYMFI